MCCNGCGWRLQVVPPDDAHRIDMLVGCNDWAKTGNDFSFLIAADGLTTPGPINGGPGNANTCRADVNSDGTLNVQDVFDYLNSYFSGCP